AMSVLCDRNNMQINIGCQATIQLHFSHARNSSLLDGAEIEEIKAHWLLQFVGKSISQEDRRYMSVDLLNC
ncbi:hypothetical protein, partial [Salmonella sp. SAL4450]|uniref:hypothetical protein n=1 Tax=Salmonella sp. SAL4450 TaxID=3159905 RepID=UPI0039787E87